VRPDPYYLDRVARALDTLGISTYSEHLAYTKLPGLDLANLLPLPLTEEAAENVIRNVATVRSHISGPFLLENPTYYFEYPESHMSESEFLSLICRETGARLLLDVENIHVNSKNHGFDPYAFIDTLPLDAVTYIHTAGGSAIDGTMIDSHDHPVSDDTLQLLGYVLRRHVPETIILERDRRLQETDDLIADVDRIRAVVDQAMHKDEKKDGQTEPTRTSA
jgi:uncharacterized protein (UPF0276 family)